MNAQRARIIDDAITVPEKEWDNYVKSIITADAPGLASTKEALRIVLKQRDLWKRRAIDCGYF